MLKLIINLIIILIILNINNNIKSESCPEDPVTFTGSRVLNEDINYKIEWAIESDEIYMKFSIDSAGWFGFGLAEDTSGSMLGSDVVIGYVDDSGMAYGKILFFFDDINIFKNNINYKIYNNS